MIAYIVTTWLSNNGFIKFFEKSWFLDVDNLVNSSIFEDFFSLIANNYDNIIQQENNVACYNFLIEKALINKLTETSKTMDFGCGSGLISKAKRIESIDELILYDCNPMMRSLATKNNLITLTSREFSELSEKSLDIIILNYVLHLNLSAKTIEKLYSLLSCGGILIGNVHKDIQLNSYTHWLKKNEIEFTIQDSPFGSCLYFIK